MTRPGHRTLPHTADLVLEAWAPSKDACLAEAVQALAATFVDPGDTPRRPVAVAVEATTDEELLVRLLEEVVYLIDAQGVVAVDADVTCRAGGADGRFWVVGTDEVAVTGPAPKAIALHAVVFEHRDDHWFARVTVDV